MLIRVLLFIFFSSSVTCFSQSFIKGLKTSLELLDNNYPQEQIFLHTDRSAYGVGESIWFKAYCTLDAQPSFLSKVVYVELVDEKGAVIQKRMLPLEKGRANGDIYIADTLQSGVYSLNAYTLWMLNFPKYIFRKQLHVYNSPAATKTSNFKKDINIHFYPEGGKIVEGLTNRIAFKAFDEGGAYLNLSGEIHNSKQEKIASFSTAHEGMGLFELDVLAGEKYRAVVVVNGVQKFFNLPPALKGSVTLKVNNDDAVNAFFELQKKATGDTANNRLFLVGRMGNTIVYFAEVDLIQEKLAGAINKKKLPAGILQLTVYNEEADVLAERLMFINNYKSEDLAIRKDSFSTGNRANNVYSINVAGYKNLSASAAVTNYDADSSLFDNSLLTSLLLTHDINGPIKNPAFYFKEKNMETQKKLDLVMLTHEWNRGKYNRRDTLPAYKIIYPIESGITVKGKITKLNGKELSTPKLDFITKADDSTTILSTITLNSGSEFALTDLNFKKAATIYYQGANKKGTGSAATISFLPSFFDTLQYSQVTIGINNLRTEPFSYYAGQSFKQRVESDTSEGIMLKNVVVNARRLSPRDSMNRLYATDLFKNSDQTFLIDGKIFSIWQFLESKLAGLAVGRDEMGETTVFFTRDLGLTDAVPSFNPDAATTNIDFYLNEVKVSKNMIESIDPTDFVLVKIWKGTSSYAIGAEQGAIALYTDKTKANKSWGNKGFDFIKKLGYSVSREFHAINYEGILPGSPLVDRRPTLYWNPELKTDADGHMQIKFFNDDFTKAYKLTIEGIDENGKIISLQTILK